MIAHEKFLFGAAVLGGMHWNGAGRGRACGATLTKTTSLVCLKAVTKQEGEVIPIMRVQMMFEKSLYLYFGDSKRRKN